VHASVLVLIAFPLLTAALFGLAADRHLGGHIYDAATRAVLPRSFPCRT
jgi:cytochrome c oxidase subunit I